MSSKPKSMPRDKINHEWKVYRTKMPDFEGQFLWKIFDREVQITDFSSAVVVRVDITK